MADRAQITMAVLHRQTDPQEKVSLEKAIRLHDHEILKAYYHWNA